MKGRVVVLVTLAAAVTLTSVGAAAPDAAKQRVAITWKGVAVSSALATRSGVAIPLADPCVERGGATPCSEQ